MTEYILRGIVPRRNGHSRLSRGIQLERSVESWPAYQFLAGVRNRWSSSTALRTAHVDGHLCAGFTRLYRPMVRRYIRFPLTLHPSVVPHKPLYFYDGRNGMEGGWKSVKIRPKDEIIQTKAMKIVSLLSFCTTITHTYTHSLRHTFQENSPRSLDPDRLEMVWNVRPGRKRGTILSRSIGYRYLDDRFQRLNTPFPWFQLSVHWSSNRD